MSDLDKRNQAFDDLTRANSWAKDCIGSINGIIRYMQFLEKMFSDKYEIFYGPVYPAGKMIVSQSETVAVLYLKELFEREHLKTFNLDQSLKAFSENDVFKALRHYELGNAHDLSPVEFRGASYITALIAVFEIGKYVSVEVLGRVEMLSKYWDPAEVDEDEVRANVSDLRSIIKIAAMVDDSLLRRLISQIKMESIRAERWLYDVYGYDGYESAIPDEQPELTVPSLLTLDSEQICNVARECKSNDPIKQNDYGSNWLAGIKKGHNFPPGDIQTGGGRGKRTIWTLDCIHSYLLDAMPWVPEEKWEQEASKGQPKGSD